MNKNKLTLVLVGGVLGVAILAAAYLVWSAYSDKVAALEGDDENEGLETFQAKASTLSHKPIYPCAISVTAVNSNADLLAEWKSEAVKLASRGDKVFSATTPAAFKTFIVADAKRLSSLPGGVNGALTKPDFAYGPFKAYIAEGSLPAEAQLPELQRKWDDVTLLVETLAASGIAELQNVEDKSQAQASAAADEESAKKNKKAKKAKKPKKSAKVDETAVDPVAYTYALTFTTRPAAFVKALNAFATGERFVVVNDFSFVRTKDAIVEKLSGDEKKQESRSSRRRGRRTAAAEKEEEKKTDESKNVFVTDPLLDEPFTVVLTATVYDFRSLENVSNSEEEK